MKKLIAIILVLVMMVSLVACGGEPDPNAGVYQAVSGTALGITMDIEEIYEGETWVELKNGGKGKICLDGQEFSLKWELEGEDITITIQGEDSVGTLEDGVISVDLMNMGLVMVFEKEAE